VRKRHARRCEDLGFTIVAFTDGDYMVDFHVYEIDCEEGAEPYLHGHVKWDGCSNWHFDEQDRAMLHCCSREDLTRIGEVMAACWDWAAELCPKWAGHPRARALS